MKKCSSCKSQFHPALKQCTCGYSFIKNLSKKNTDSKNSTKSKKVTSKKQKKAKEQEEDSEGELIFESDYSEEEEEEEEEEKEGNDSTWKKEIMYEKQIKFTEPTGTTVRYNTELETFTSIWNDEIMDMIVTETNRYGNDYIKDWYDTDKIEMMYWIGIVLLISLSPPRVDLQLLWSKD